MEKGDGNTGNYKLSLPLSSTTVVYAGERLRYSVDADVLGSAAAAPLRRQGVGRVRAAVRRVERPYECCQSGSERRLSPEYEHVGCAAMPDPFSLGWRAASDGPPGGPPWRPS